MSELILLRGLPASGKSKLAQRMLGKNVVRVNRDLRTMLHFDTWSPKNERCTAAMAHLMVRDLLKTGRSVIVDDTNLSRHVVDVWRQTAQICGASVKLVDVPTPWDECVRRDQLRSNAVGRSVIVGMAIQYGLYPIPANGFVLCDIDGTLADISHRLHFVSEPSKDWDGFFGAMDCDAPRSEVLDLVRDFTSAGHHLIMLSARPSKYRDVTERWLSRIGLEYGTGGCMQYTALLMRAAGDRRPDTVVKQEILHRHFPERFSIHVVIDDRPSVIRMWRENRLSVIDVGEGVEF